MTVLFDFDSLIYQSVYKIASFSKIRSWISRGKTRDWMEKEICNLSINRLSNMSDNIFLEIEDTGLEVSSIEYYITTAKNSFRKEKSKTYKANRKRNKWVSMVRKMLIEMDFAIGHDELEADDLIVDRAKELGPTKCIILSIDKDMKQLEGIHFDYYRPKSTISESGEIIINRCRGVFVIDPFEASKNFWTQMLVGDSSDNIKGIPRVGKKTAEKILSSCTDEDEMETIVRQKYKESYNDEGYTFNLNYSLIKLGK